MHSVKQTRILITAVLIAFITVKLIRNVGATYTFYTQFLDERCNVTFDIEKLEEDEEDSRITRLKNYDECYTTTFEKTKRKQNLTEEEHENCVLKCMQVQDEFLETDGSFNERLVNKIKRQYKKYSDATNNYVENVKNLFSGCIDKSRKQLELQQKSSKDVAECEVNNLYHECLLGILDFAKSLNETEFCGTSKTVE